MKYKRILGVVAVLALVCWGILFNARAAGASGQDEDVLHPLSKRQFNQFCLEQGYEHGVTAIGNDAYSVRCVDGYGHKVSLNEIDSRGVGAVCMSAYFYLDTPMLDRLKTMGETYTGWECMNSISHAGEPDIQGWCESRGLHLVYAGHPDGYKAYGWWCAGRHGRIVEGIPMDKVCMRDFGPDALDRTYDVYNKFAWECKYVR